MNLSDQVVSLELSKRLKELGVNQKSLFYWDEYKNINDEHELKYIIPENHIAAGYRQFYMKDDHHYSAFTVAELGELLPSRSYSFRGDFEHKWECTIDLLEDEYYTTSGGNTEADARARLLIHLLENNMPIEKRIEKPESLYSYAHHEAHYE